MLTKPNFQRLLDVAKATEIQPLDRFDMSEVFVVSNCGTAGCMIGNYNAMFGRKPNTFIYTPANEREWIYFGITHAEYCWLFCEHADVRSWRTNSRRLAVVTKEQALRRLRLFLYYKLHKHELCYDEKYGVSQESRTKEGNHGFATRALAECGA